MILLLWFVGVTKGMKGVQCGGKDVIVGDVVVIDDKIVKGKGDDKFYVSILL